LDIFRRLLTHEIGHAIGLGDVEGSINPGRFIEDNYDGTSATTISNMPNNSWTHLVNPLDPANSTGPQVFNVPNGNTSTAGVDILKESFGAGDRSGEPGDQFVPAVQ
jgi:hypothetical protein